MEKSNGNPHEKHTWKTTQISQIKVLNPWKWKKQTWNVWAEMEKAMEIRKSYLENHKISLFERKYKKGQFRIKLFAMCQWKHGNIIFRLPDIFFNLVASGSEMSKCGCGSVLWRIVCCWIFLDLFFEEGCNLQLNVQLWVRICLVASLSKIFSII